MTQTINAQQLNTRQASWLFLPQGLVMPARVPNGGKEGTADPKFTDNGRFDIQVRGRKDSHLENVLRDYFTPLGLEHSEIEYTPQFDYNVRFYTTREALAQFYMQVALDTDSLKFKPLAEDKNEDGSLKYRDGHNYHSVLNSIWGVVTGIGRAGGSWGTYSATNPNGYKASKGKSIGSSFGSRLSDEVGLDGRYDDDFDSYSPRSSRRASDIISEMEGIPQSDWEDYLTRDEMELVEPYMDFDGILTEAGRAEVSRPVSASTPVSLSRREAAKQARQNRKAQRHYKRQGR